MNAPQSNRRWFAVRCEFTINGEVAERPKALDWNFSNIFTGVRGFESHPLRHSTIRIKRLLVNSQFIPSSVPSKR